MPRYHVEIEGREFDVTIEYRASGYEVSLNGRACKVQAHRMGDSRMILLLDNTSLEVDVRQNGSAVERTVFMRGLEIPATIEDFNLAQLRKTAGFASGPARENLLRAPMPGLVIDVRVSPGDTVKIGTPLVVIEAMKMENILKAKTGGVVKTVQVSKGQSVEKLDILVEFE